MSAEERIKQAREVVRKARLQVFLPIATDTSDAFFSQSPGALRTLLDAADDLFAAVDERDALNAEAKKYALDLTQLQIDHMELLSERDALRKRVAELECKAIPLVVP